jgi:hypothetical protein
MSPVFLYLYLGVTLLPSDTDQPSIFVAYGFSGWIKGTCSNEKKVGITAAQLALGFRATMIMNKIGVKEDEIKYFITDSIVVMILDFLHKMSPYICKTYFQFILTYLFQRRLSKRKSRQKRELEQQIEDLKQQILELNSEWFTFRELLDEAIQKQRMIASDLQWYSDLWDTSR